jgi:hypothetical protein
VVVLSMGDPYIRLPRGRQSIQEYAMRNLNELCQIPTFGIMTLRRGQRDIEPCIV